MKASECKTMEKKITNKAVNIEKVGTALTASGIFKATTKTITSGSFAKQLTTDNCTYLISGAFDLKDEVVTLPKNATLYFKPGGSLSNGTLVGQNGCIVAERKVFDRIHIEGSWCCIGNAGWWAEGTTDVEKPNNEYVGLQSALDSSFSELVFPPAKFYTGSTLTINNPKRIVLQGVRTRWPLSWDKSVCNTTIVFTDKNIHLLTVNLDDNGKYNTVEITGGNFDTSLCPNYTSSCIRVLADDCQKIWGLKISTNLMGKFSSVTGVGIDLNPIYNEKAAPNTAFITNVRIDSDISYFGTGVRAVQWGDNKNWLTDVYIDGNIRFCPCAIDTSAGGTFTASLQAGAYYSEQQNNAALIVIRGGKTSVAIGCAIYDIYAGDKDSGKWSNRYAVWVEDQNGGDHTQDSSVTLSCATIVPFGRFEAFLIGSNFHHVSFIKGRAKIPVMKDIYFNGGTTPEKSASVLVYGDELYNKV